MSSIDSMLKFDCFLSSSPYVMFSHSQILVVSLLAVFCVYYRMHVNCIPPLLTSVVNQGKNHMISVVKKCSDRFTFEV